MQICVLEPTDIFLADIFSPNGDGQNDILFMRGKGIKEFRLLVYDRWGEKMFETTDLTLGWDGNYKGKPASQGVYVYYLDALMNTDKKIIMKGDVTLIR